MAAVAAEIRVLAAALSQYALQWLPELLPARHSAPPPARVPSSPFPFQFSNTPSLPSAPAAPTSRQAHLHGGPPHGWVLAPSSPGGCMAWGLLPSAAACGLASPARPPARKQAALLIFPRSRASLLSTCMLHCPAALAPAVIPDFRIPGAAGDLPRQVGSGRSNSALPARASQSSAPRRHHLPALRALLPANPSPAPPTPSPPHPPSLWPFTTGTRATTAASTPRAACTSLWPPSPRCSSARCRWGSGVGVGVCSWVRTRAPRR